ncbi:glycosyltransferase [Blastococcus saxobsidens]|uniref:Putative Glycosyltransferase-like n=1 Tax=Blastococcus saxobsidens (strain DD2) TaxID=1146883 RepID=H6RN26_BLASD|nr:glycosyltransferase family 2 protein [Blastococcus saxobsidens]CCG01379.1 putative Glycosyltransferase-like [Blastococcus saxobsidens DD2]
MVAVPLTERDVELVVVTYRSRAQLEGLLSGLSEDLPVVVVDNSDGVDGVDEVVSKRPRGRYLPGGGVGFARAANLGARTSTAEYLVFLNPDIRPTDEVLATLVQDVADDPTCAASAATRADAAGRPQKNGGWEPSVGRAFTHALGAHKVFRRAGLYATPRLDQPLAVDWVSGGCMAVRRETFLSLGGFDESFYVYCEDMAYGRAAREHGLTERLRTDVTFVGDAGGSGAPSLEMARLRGAAMTRYVRKHNPAAVALAINAVNAAGYAVRAAQLRLRGDRTTAQVCWAYVKGAVTARATVAGRVVTR